MHLLPSFHLPWLTSARPSDRREALQFLLRTLLQTHLQLVDSLTHPPREYMAWMPAAPTEPPAEGQPAPPPQMVPVPRSVAQDRWEHMRTTVINMQHLINELRPKQVSVCGAPTRVGRLC